MICNRYEVKNEDNVHIFYPILEENKENVKVNFMIPKDAKKQFAAPFISFEDKVLFALSDVNKLICTVYYQRFIHCTKEIYPDFICVKVKGNKYVKFKFEYFLTTDKAQIPFVNYLAIDIVGKEQASQCQVCIEEE